MALLRSRLAARFKQASYFSLNDVVLYGKYKNHRGKIVSFGNDKWGNPTIEVEPIPKGRKQNKIIGLFKIWRADVKEKALAEMADKTSSAVVRPDANLAEVRKRKQELFDSLSEEEILVLKLVATNKGVMGRLGDEDLVYSPSPKKYDKKPWGKAATRLVKTGWLRHHDGPSRDGFGWFHLTTAGENALRAFSEGSPALLKQAGTMSDSARRLAARYIKANGIDVGRTVNINDFRIHRYREMFEITDLANAGKRGKKVKVLAVTLGYGSQIPASEHETWFDGLGKGLVNQTSFESVRNFLNHIKEGEPYLEVSIRETRGIDVEPTGSKITLKTNTGLVIEAAPNEFRVLNKQPLTHPKTGESIGFQDTNYYNKGKESAAVFFTWIQANLSKVNSLDMNGLRNVWNQLNVNYDYH